MTDIHKAAKEAMVAIYAAITEMSDDDDLPPDAARMLVSVGDVRAIMRCLNHTRAALDAAETRPTVAEAARDVIARLIMLDNLRLLRDFDIDSDLYRTNPQYASLAYATTDAIIRAIAGGEHAKAD